MKGFMVFMLVSAFSLSALACDGSGSKGKKEKQEEDKRIELAI